jgi:mRNA-degrading endonuclease RelE of RelBE toxin-antitoxin system
MPRSRTYEVVYDDEAMDHLIEIGQRHHSLIRREIETQLRYQPNRETRNRKPLTRPSPLGSAWELRCGPDHRFRVFYRMDQGRRQVRILAVGVKIRDQLFMAGQRLKL